MMWMCVFFFRSPKASDNGFVGQMKNLRERKRKSREESRGSDSENTDGYRKQTNYHKNNEKDNAKEHLQEHREGKQNNVCMIRVTDLPPVQARNQGLCPMSNVRQKSCRCQVFGHWTSDTF